MLNTEIGSPDAEAYCSVAQADTYFDNRANAAWPLLTIARKEAALREATDYLSQAYRMLWLGCRADGVQALDWPRLWVPLPDAPYTLYASRFTMYVPSTTIPKEIINASAELALRSTEGALLEDIDPPVIEETLGPITTRYAPGARRIKCYPSIDRMLTPFLESRGIKFVKS